MGPPVVKGNSGEENSWARLVRREEFIGGGVSGLSRNLPEVDVWSSNHRISGRDYFEAVVREVNL